MSPTDLWLDPLLGKHFAQRARVLVLCRSSATQAAVRRWMAIRGGWIGVEVATVHGLALQVYRAPPGQVEPPAQPLPDDCEMGRRVAGRPGLAAVARRWTHQLQHLRMLGRAPVVPPWLSELVDGNWAHDPSLAARRFLLERAQIDPLKLTESHRYEAIVPVGLSTSQDALDPWVRAVVQALCPGVAPRAKAANRVLPRREVDDVVAEARLAASLAAAHPQGTLILLSEAHTEARVRDALTRAGVAVGWCSPSPIAGHELAAIARTVAPWFSVDTPSLTVHDLARVFGHRRFTGLDHQAAMWLDVQWTANDVPTQDPHIRGRPLREMLGATGLLDASLTDWIRRLRTLAEPGHPAAIRVSALALWARLQLLQACRLGQNHPLRVDDLPIHFDDTDDRYAELLGRLPPSQTGELAPAPAHSVRAIGRLLVSLRPEVDQDRTARSVLRKLNEQSGPATTANLQQAFAGAPRSQQVCVGVDLLSVDDYDGRPCHQLILVDLHHQGLTRRPAPDPLLSDSEQTRMGVPTGRDRVDHRVQQLLLAAENAQEITAIVAERDAGGRDLVAPIQLSFCEHAGAHDPVGSYGFALQDSAEVRRTQALVARPGPPSAATDRSRLSHLAVQGSVEWYRAGRGFTDRVPVLEQWGVYPDQLDLRGPFAPPWVAPYMGDVRVPEGQLNTDRTWSNTALFNPLSDCLYRAFSTAILGLSPEPPLADDLDPRALGTLVHKALEATNAGLQMRAPHQRLDEAKHAVVQDLRRETQALLAAASADLAALSSTRRAAVQGRISRWSEHWQHWAHSRVVGPDLPGKFELGGFVRDHPLTQDTARELIEALPEGHGLTTEDAVRWLAEISESLLRGTDLATLNDSQLCRTGQRWGALPVPFAAAARTVLQRRSEDLRNVWRSAKARGRGSNAPVIATGVAIPYGPDARQGRFAIHGQQRPMHLGPVSVDFGPVRLHLEGRIDRLSVSNPGGTLLIDLLDYKTGRGKPPHAYAAMKRLQRAQAPDLLVDALAVQAALASPHAPPELKNARVAAVGWDHVQHTTDEKDGRHQPAKNKVGRMIVDSLTLGASAHELGRLLVRARDAQWPLSPFSCPKTTYNARCAFSSACRFRAHPPSTTEESP